MKKYYVKGGIYVDTPFFKYGNAGAGYGETPIPDAEMIPTNRKLPTGEKYLLIDDQHPQTIFAEYYAGTFFTTGYCWAPMFHNSYEDDYVEFKKRIEDARLLMNTAESIEDDNTKALLSRYSFLTIMCAFDTFVADTLLTRLVNDEVVFYEYAHSLENQRKLQEYLNSGINGLAEKEVMEYILRQSYCSKDRVIESYKHLFGFSVTVGKQMNDLFFARHRIAHRGGRKKDGSFVSYSKSDIEDAIRTVDRFVLEICDKIQEWNANKSA